MTAAPGDAACAKQPEHCLTEQANRVTLSSRCHHTSNRPKLSLIACGWKLQQIVVACRSLYSSIRNWHRCQWK
eukprot:4981633-Amphidinium_carterae.3